MYRMPCGRHRRIVGKRGRRPHRRAAMHARHKEKDANGALLHWARALSLVVFPTRCIACRCMLPTRPPYQLCNICAEALQPNDSARCSRCDLPGAHNACLMCPVDLGALTQMRLPLVCNDAVSALLQAGRMPHRGDVWQALGALIAQDGTAKALAEHACYIVPVPADVQRLRWAGHNCRAVLARHVARGLGLAVAYILKRTRSGRRQSACKPAQRTRNMTAAFVCTRRAAHTVILVDDCVVTGASAHAAARALRAAGAERIFMLGAARSPCMPRAGL